ncbi:caspase family protein [Rhodospira trueperi]|uniref:caspase family protein n=1 Tax=Rhodospira trueperi TaxID=69960 RepID=UPI000B84156A|nr:caspase family protein [Rhodospira trueperi]
MATAGAALLPFAVTAALSTAVLADDGGGGGISVPPLAPPPMPSAEAVSGGDPEIGAGGGASASASGMRALIVGIDAYEHITPLDGAVNDARSIQDSLSALGVKDITVLLNADASRDAIMAAWADLIDRSAPDDLLFITYAGHGSQLPERRPGTEEDGKDEVFLLARFSEAAPNNGERIVDDEISELLEKAQDRTVVFIADSCHSGTVTRSFDPRAGQRRTRFTDVGPIEDDMLPPPAPTSAADDGGAEPESGASVETDALGHVVFVAGVDEDKLVPEVTIDGQSHGALSYSVAQALRGEADRDGDGQLTVEEFQHYLRQSVRLHTEGRQSIRMERGASVSATRALAKVPAGGGGGGSGSGFGAGSGGGIASTGAGAAPLANAPSVRVRPQALFVTDADDGAADDTAGLAALETVALAGSAEDADLVWDVAAGALLSSLGDVVATLPEPAPGEDRSGAVGRVVTKWALVETLKSWPEAKRLTLGLSPSDGLHHVGETVTLTIEGHTLPYLTVFNLDPFGVLNRVFPIPKLGDQFDAFADGKAFDLPMEVYQPVGGDHFVAIATEQPPLALYDALTSLDGRPVEPGFLTLLRQAVLDQRYEMGLHGVFTAE